MEIWKDVVGYEGIYEVSTHGRVRTHINKTTHSNRHGVRKWRQRVLKEKDPKGRDVRVSLWKDKVEKSHLVHRLVADAFIPRTRGKDSINHIDGNPRNNHVSNLEWCDYKHNNNHAFDTGLIKTGREIFLVHKETGEAKYFRSMARAGKFLGKNAGYISALLKRGEKEVDDYRILFAVIPGEEKGVIACQHRINAISG
ncbi:HNH endonuclease [Salinicoccus sp. ID82-1]|uniref:NUMOD4 domain-containing protein n=1 Tax=Salinicoccus sp. ID82-1 TaxID=2820269 RepID=UPI001F193B37|nr:NUMOD4 domain-containing protein [Salinicoccus sp. ID82-1]MCG1009249.1 HNH endonuclease [Salinicoccus sp. ID82-1]